MIAGFTVRDDLKSLRQVSKSWKDVATPILFSELTFRMHTTPEEWSKRVRFEMGAFVKTFTVTTIEYEDLDFEEYKECLEEIHGGGGDVQHSVQHLRQGFASYKQCRSDHMELLEERHCLAYLTILLNPLINLRKVKLTGDYLDVNQPNPHRLEDHHGNLSNYRSALSTSTCNDRASLAVGPISGLADLGKTHLQVLFSALAVARSPLSELTINDFPGGHLRYKAFDIPATHGNLAVFSSLTVLNLNFVYGFYDDPEVPATTNINPEGISFVARTLSCAINLLRLTLTLDHERGWDDVAPNELHLILHGCRLPKLLTCKLRCSIISYTTLANFIRGSPSLSQLTIWETDTDFDTVHDIHTALGKEFPQLTLEIDGNASPENTGEV